MLELLQIDECACFNDIFYGTVNNFSLFQFSIPIISTLVHAMFKNLTFIVNVLTNNFVSSSSSSIERLWFWWIHESVIHDIFVV